MDEHRPVYEEMSDEEYAVSYKNLGAKKNHAGAHWEQPKVV